MTQIFDLLQFLPKKHWCCWLSKNAPTLSTLLSTLSLENTMPFPILFPAFRDEITQMDRSDFLECAEIALAGSGKSKKDRSDLLSLSYILLLARSSFKSYPVNGD
jgi:hypothetical protein